MGSHRIRLAAVFLAIALYAGALDKVPGAVTASPSSSPEYLTLNPGDLVDLSPGPVRFGDYPALLRQAGVPGKYRAAGSGHTKITVGAGSRARTLLVFVTPMVSRHVGRWDMEWYRTQFGSGRADCGPANISMAVLWARGKSIPVRTIRSEIGYPHGSGATSFDDLRRMLGRHHVEFLMTPVRAVQDLVAILERGHIALTLIRCAVIGKVKGDPRENLVGRYYDYEGGHYLLLKGYSTDRKYFVVYDPYPAGWDGNRLRYADGETMIGKNRYYPSAQVLSALKTQHVLEVEREAE